MFVFISDTISCSYQRHLHLRDSIRQGPCASVLRRSVLEQGVCATPPALIYSSKATTERERAGAEACATRPASITTGLRLLVRAATSER